MTQSTNEKSPTGGWTLLHILMGVAFFMPAVTVVNKLRDAGGTPLQYTLGVASALIAGCCIVLLEWYLGKFFWLRSQKQHTEAVQKIVAIGLTALQLVWIVIGYVVGLRLAGLIVNH